MMDEAAAKATFVPEIMLDAGDTDWAILRGILAARLDELQPGAVLEISSLAQSHGSQLLDWCRQTGYDCFQMSVDGDRTWFWIKKR